MSQKENYNNSTLSIIQLQSEELNQIYSSEKTQTLYVQSSFSLLNAIVQYSYPSTQKLYTELSYPHVIVKRNFYCSRSQNIVTMYICINSYMTATNEITFNLTNTELEQLFLLQITNN